MRRIGILAGALGAGVLAQLASLGNDVVTIDRERPVIAKRRRLAPAMQFTGNRSRYMPYQGEKERERAARCYESEFLNQKFVDYWLAHPMNVTLSSDQCHARSTPTLCQMSKRQYEARSREAA